MGALHYHGPASRNSAIDIHNLQTALFHKVPSVLTDTDNETPVECIHTGLAWTHLSARHAHPVQRGLDPGDIELDAG